MYATLEASVVPSEFAGLRFDGCITISAPDLDRHCLRIKPLSSQDIYYVERLISCGPSPSTGSSTELRIALWILEDDSP